jgi:hypothetical protein
MNEKASPTRRGPGMNARDAATYCGVKVSTLAKWRQSGQGPKFSDRLRRDPRYHIDDLDAFLWGDGVVSNSVEASERRARRKRELTPHA